MLNLIIHLDDESQKLDPDVWKNLEEVVFNLALSYHDEAGSTEPCYLMRVVNRNRVSYIKCRVKEEVIHMVYDAVQYFMKKYQVPDSMSVSVLATDFNQSIIVTKDTIEPWSVER